ncbi:cytochrome P450 704C1 isoform X2 [Lactuca sativa]|uniref:cytochrome P450 704C1 isoform X2 n=1 Tax=Lactuca sativa TaxID=4236 RepID=UPI000CD9BDA3|nr:cytochrome P450 704C1 isoform X2 [Lactuca sativa]
MDFLSIPIIILVPIFLLLVFFYTYNQQHTYGRKTKKYHPVCGTVFNLLIHFNKVHDYLTDLAEKYKTFRLISPFHGEIYTTDPVNVEYILKTNFENYGKGTYTHNILEDLLGHGIFTIDGDKWREQRKVSSHEFSTNVLRNFSSVIFKNNTIKLGNILSEAANNNQIIDIYDLFMKATIDSIFKVAFGIDLDNICGSSEEGVRFSRAFDDANTLTSRRFVDILWKIKKYFNIGSEAELKKNMKVVNEFVYDLIRIKIEQMDKTNNEFSLIKEDILSRFLQMKYEDPKYLRDIILSYVLAGKDPIGITMSWFIYLLCKHPEVQDKVAREIKEATNVKEEITNVAEFAAYVTEGALKKMQYLHAALTETIRLYPALPMDPKICFSDDVLPDGYNVKKGDMVSYLPYAMGRMKFIWGEDAHEYNPKRWLDENGYFHPENPFKFTAFQAGPRTCLGRDFAYMQIKIFSSILLGCFMFKLSDVNKVPRYRMSINLHIDGPLEILVYNRFGLKNR